MEYQLQVKGHHRDLDIDTTGLRVNPKFPHLGTSPDGLISCSCCGRGVVEIKCPFSIRNSSSCNATYLEPAESGYRLQRSHYQVQGQLALLEREYCDFVVWTPHGLHVEHIHSQPAFFTDMSKKLEEYYIKIILPRVLVGSNKMKASETIDVYCYCRKREFGNMIGCDGSACKIKWFHFKCVGINTPPERPWFCPDCTKMEHDIASKL